MIATLIVGGVLQDGSLVMNVNRLKQPKIMNEIYSIKNEVLYDRNCLSDAIRAYQETINQGRAIGKIVTEHDTNHSTGVPLHLASHKINALIEKEEGQYTVHIQILETPQGELLRSMVSNGTVDFIYSGLGKVEGGIVYMDQIISIDAMFSN
jgi:hypothetical protein